MSTSVETIQNWFKFGQEVGASHMLVKMDWFDHSDYPVYVKPGQDPKVVANEDQDRTMECYTYNLPWEHQAAEYRAAHWDMY